MNARVRILSPLLIAAFIAIVLMTAGCACTPQPKQTGTAASTVPTATPVETSTPSGGEATVSAGPTTPAKGSADRKALLDAARAKLGTSSEFYVHQLFVDGAQGVGDLESVNTKSRWFVVWTGGPGDYKAVWTQSVGNGDAAKAAARSQVPDLKTALVDKLDWSVKKSLTQDAASMKSDLAASAKGWTKLLMNGKGSPYKVESCKVAQDSSGKWWGRVVIQPTGDSSNQYEPVEYWAKYAAGEWNGKAQDPEPPSPGTYFPSSVVSKLF